MEIFKIVAFAFVALSIFLLFKDRRNDLSILIALVAGIIIFLFIIGQLSDVIYFLKNIADRANIDSVYIGIVFKILAIAYLASFCSEICKDAGASSIASKVDFSAKILILGLAIPILMAVLDTILQML
ncbi:stage III sporulation protein AD [Clostridium gasigenes]|uniref:Stage III sporulation protein AD n=1 Tax=Clostridium gasigenes TaxID=94869 RepID=A0A1H0MYW3_9CLOT|nr:stage III sporulation protein AD [Clostridium gasigenes]MBB6625177.1 stage III sporulation protein AD [Clostridium gasigenes]MBB6716181.1 stage III sporulation protein AD [Clostridium gasigenes]MBU3087369.1 stage III sporulation protein AD [Clostridium gasigenes]MBU3102898.1 stage III sporulation protein AD [Clostridium gasigenes]MBU3106608.1 stage III sporulation protein AD [Clostridium gasigenes]